jgi:hypothetical protein
VIRGIGGTLDVDDAGAQEAVLPGWTPTDDQALMTGEDEHGTFAAAASGETAMFLRSSEISTAIVDLPNRVDKRFYAISYALGASGLLQVVWVDEAGGDTNVCSRTPRARRPGTARATCGWPTSWASAAASWSR